jgi:hypothetical protein
MTNTKETRKQESQAEARNAPPPEFSSRKERLDAGKALRETVPHEHHAAWTPAERRHPIDGRPNNDRSVTLY